MIDSSSKNREKSPTHSVADPGFPVGGGHALVWGGMDLRRGHFSVKMYAKTKELGPIGGGHAPGMPPRSANDTSLVQHTS